MEETQRKKKLTSGLSVSAGLAEERRGMVRGLQILSTGTHGVIRWAATQNGQGPTRGPQHKASANSLSPQVWLLKTAGTMQKKLWIFQYLHKRMAICHISFPCDSTVQWKSGRRGITCRAEEGFTFYQWLKLIFFQPVEIQVQNTKYVSYKK